jgi:rhodanese-related sulfurtransferase
MALRQPQAHLKGTAREVGAALIIDVRSPRQFRRGHLPGSHSIPAARLVSGALPDGDLILITEQPQQALGLIEQLHRDGYLRRIQYLDGGVASWQRQGLPLQSDELLAHRGDSSAAPGHRLGGLLLLLLAAARGLLSPLLLALRQWLRPRGQRRAKS